MHRPYRCAPGAVSFRASVGPLVGASRGLYNSACVRGQDLAVHAPDVSVFRSLNFWAALSPRGRGGRRVQFPRPHAAPCSDAEAPTSPLGWAFEPPSPEEVCDDDGDGHVTGKVHAHREDQPDMSDEEL